VIYLTLPELLHIAGRALGGEPKVRDHGLLESAAARPQATDAGLAVLRRLPHRPALLSQSST
jgi:death on curing protein